MTVHLVLIEARQAVVLDIGSLCTVAESGGLEELFAFWGHVFPEEVAGFALVAVEFLRGAVFEALDVSVEFGTALGVAFACSRWLFHGMSG